MSAINIKQDATYGSGMVGKNGNFLHNFNYVETASTATNMKAFGTTKLSSTAAKTYTLDAPSAGVGTYKEFIKTAASTAIITVSVGSGQYIGGSTAATKLLFNGQNDSAAIRAISTSQWVPVSLNSVTIST